MGNFFKKLFSPSTQAHRVPIAPTSSRYSAKRVATPGTDYDYLFKFCIVGDTGCGKSSLLLRYVDGVFTDSWISTIGVDFKIKNTVLNGGKTAKLQIWDTAGQERFRTITTSYYRNTQGVLIVFDLTNRETFRTVPKWLTDIERYTDDGVVRFLIGNKSDVSDRREVSREEAEELARQYNMRYIETSAKASQQVAETFEALALDVQQYVTRYDDE